MIKRYAELIGNYKSCGIKSPQGNKLKIGKTTLAAQADDCLLLAAERGYNAIPNVIAQDITSWNEMKQAFRELKKPEVKKRFKVLVVDTIDLMAKYCTKYICNNNGIEELGELPYGRGYALMRSEFEDVFNALAQMGYAIIFLGHHEVGIFTRPDGTEYTTIFPALAPTKVRAIIENMADIYGYAHPILDEAGVETRRVLTLRSTDGTVSCGCRFAGIESEIEFTYPSLVKAIQEAIDKEDQGMVTDTPIQAPSYDFNEEMNNFNSLVSKIQANVSTEDFAGKWAPTITKITDSILGRGKKVGDMKPDQANLLHAIVQDLISEVNNGL